jgi:hypothetical protein
MLQPDKNKAVNKITVLKRKAQPTGEVVASTTESIPYTDKNAESREGRKKGGFYGSETEGVKVDKTTGNTTAKPFSRKVVVSPGGHTRIIGDDGTVVSEGPARSSTIKKAVEDSEKKVRVTNQQREHNARANNLVGGTATNITQKEVDALNRDKQATGNALDPKIVAASKREQELRDSFQKAKTTKVRIASK